MSPDEGRRPGRAASTEHIGRQADGSSLKTTTPNSWDASDLSTIAAGLAAGTLETPRPSIGRLERGSYLLYPGRTSGIAAESGAGKTFTALRLTQTELEDGRSVVYVDFEDTAIGVVARLLAMGVPSGVIADSRRFAYVQPDESFLGASVVRFMTLIAAMQPSLVVIDSTGESMALEGADPNSDDQVARWFQQLPTAVARLGPAVLLIDHLPKADNGASSPIGSQRKRAAISGVQLIQSVKKSMAFARGRAGEAELVCTKDRAGFFVTGEKVASLVVNPNDTMPDGSGCDVLLIRADASAWAPTKHMAEVSAHLETCAGPANTNQICTAVKGKKETLSIALKILVASGYASATAGSRGAIEYAFIKRYRIGNPYTLPDDLGRGPSGTENGSACGHEWHSGSRCNANWCHAGHHGECNESTEESAHSDDEVYAGLFQRAKEDGRFVGRDTEKPAPAKPWEDAAAGSQEDDPTDEVLT